MKKIPKRFRSWATWVSITGAVWMFLSAFGLPQKWGISSEGWNTSLTALGALLTAFGILNNPTDPSSF